MNSPIRGLRNNNPFNIKKSRFTWLGKVSGLDPTFETFKTIDFGLRCGLKLLLTYVSRGINTPYKIIHRYAPTSENNTQNYISFVCRTSAGVKRFDPNQCITGLDDLLFLASRIIKYECHLSSSQMYAYGFQPNDLKNICNKFNLKFK